jgi:Phosphotransferase enzyme family
VSFELVAALLLPPGASREAQIVRADRRWSGQAPARETGPVVFGREPSYEPAGAALVRYAWERERAVARLRRRPPVPMADAAVHRWPQRFYRARFLPGLMGWLRQGVLVELAEPEQPPRLLDLAAQAAGSARRVGAFHIGSGGSATVRITLGDGRSRVLRTALADSPADPARSAEALERLAPLGLACVPILSGRGRIDGASWTSESVLPGRPPGGSPTWLAREVARFCLALPRGSGRATAFDEDLRALVAKLPRVASPLLELLARTSPEIDSLPAVTSHGDLWSGNVLVEDDRLTGVIDWDAWHPAGVPGTDLLHFTAADLALQSRRSFAEVLLERPWTSGGFREAAVDYWSVLGVEPREEILRAVGVAWWAGQTASDLIRHPNHAKDERWLARNVAPILTLHW